MKRLILFIAIVALTHLSLFAGYNSSVLKLKVFNNALFSVALDGYHNGVLSSKAVLTDLPPGNHFLEIFVNRNQGFGNQYGHFNGYGAGPAKVKVFAGNVFIQPNSVVRAKFDQGIGFRIIDVVPIKGLACQCGFTHAGACNQQVQGYTLQPGQHQGGINAGAGYNNPSGFGYGVQGISGYNTWVPAAIGQASFEELLRSIEQQPFDGNKREIAKLALDANWMSSNQVRRLLGLFDYESSRLEIAKYAYHKTIDQQNYHVVHNVFQFGGSVSSLIQYIQNV